jgi:uncharacterized protein YndB with AHSA1/START domain
MAKVTVSSVIDAPVEDVWKAIRDFNGLPSWHPRMVESHIEDGLPADRIGCVRNFQLASGARLREKLTDFSDADFRVSYSILETPQPLTNHKATLQLRRVTDGNRTYAEWTAEFDCDPAREKQLAQDIGQGVFQGGFDALKRRFPAGR